MKTIDVMEGDEFGADSYLCQIRRGMFRNFYANSVSGWSKGGRLAENPQLRPVAMNDALLILKMAGYNISFGERETSAAKPEAKPADVAARTVHLRSDAHLSAVVDRVNGLADWVHALESRLAAEKTDRPLWVNRDDAPTAEEIRAAVDLAKQLRAERDKPADKDAARVVKAPGRPVYGDGDWRKGVEWEAKRWVAALKDAGIKVEAAE